MKRTCRCPAYPFPHRWRGGKCKGETPEPEYERPSGIDLDQLADDPRRGQAEWINRQTRGLK